MLVAGSTSTRDPTRLSRRSLCIASTCHWLGRGEAQPRACQRGAHRAAANVAPAARISHGVLGRRPFWPATFTAATAFADVRGCGRGPGGCPLVEVRPEPLELARRDRTSRRSAGG